MSETTQNNNDQFIPKLEHFAERLNLVYAYFLCTLKFQEDKDISADTSNDYLWVIQTIQNGCLNSSLLAIRDINDFLQPRNKNSRKDDLKASDFGYANCKSFLTETELKDIHKRIAHSTTKGIGDKPFKWDIWEIASKCFSQSWEFLKYIESHHGKRDDRIYTASYFYRIKSQKIYAYVSSEIQKQNY